MPKSKYKKPTKVKQKNVKKYGKGKSIFSLSNIKKTKIRKKKG